MKSFTVSLLLAFCSLGCAGDQASDASLEEPSPPSVGPDAAAVDGSGGTGDSGAKATADQGAGEDAPPAPAANVARCGPEPYQLVKLAARNLMAPTNQRDLAGARITLAHCPGVEVVTGGDGKAQINVTQGALTWFRFDAMGFVPWLCGAMKVVPPLGAQGLSASLLSESLAPGVLTTYRKDRPFIYVLVQAGRATADAACRARDGVVISVKDHPEAIVLYRQAGSMGPYLAGSATTAEGAALITGLSAGLGAVELIATKKGCTYVAAYGDANAPELIPIASAPLQNGAVTYQVFNPMR